MSESRKGNTSHLGHPHSEEAKKRISESRKNKGTGSTNGNWKGGKSSEDYKERRYFAKIMRDKVFIRDDFICNFCKERGVDLQVDHIKSWAKYPELRFILSNLRTLCSKCHYQITFNKVMPPTVKAWGHNYKERN